MTKPSFLFVAGHRNTTGGNELEASLTPNLAREYTDAFRAAGYHADYLQRDVDGDNDPNYTNGSLDLVGADAAAWIAKTPGQVVMIDCHYEGASAPGCFAIVPDKKNLGTAIRVWQPDTDQWENNTLDVALGRAISHQIADHTGLSLRQGIKEPGVMSETETGVGIQYTARLAMFAYTAPYRDRAVRLVVEHGSLPVAGDKAIILQSDFTQKCVAAMLAAVASVYSGDASADPIPAPDPKTPADPKPTDTIYPDGMDEGIASWLFGTVVTDDGIYSFNPRGSLSGAWLDRGKETGTFPELVEVRTFDVRTYYRFADGWIMFKPDAHSGVRAMKGDK